MTQRIEIIALGDSAVLIRLKETDSGRAAAQAAALHRTLARAALPGVLETVPTAAAVAIYYDPFAVWQEARRADPAGDAVEAPFETVRRWVLTEIEHMPEATAEPGRIVEIPVCYGGAFGPDLADVAAFAGLSCEEVIRLHTKPLYAVAMLGFMPGFPYLEGLPETLCMPRRAEPRVQVPAGSVGIGGDRTGIYPLAAPGGWKLIGRTPLRLFRPELMPPVVLAQGDRVRFYAIEEADFRPRHREGADGP